MGLFEIRGSMSLAEIQLTTGVPADHILRELGLPPGTSIHERLRTLKDVYGFEVSQVRRIVEAFKGAAPIPPVR
jgi:hypothetical protein